MRSNVLHEPPDPPEQRVILDMSVEEFAVIYGLAYRHNGGDPFGLRGDVENGLAAALGSLHPEWAGKVRKAAPSRGGASIAEDVERIFGEDS